MYIEIKYEGSNDFVTFSMATSTFMIYNNELGVASQSYPLLISYTGSRSTPTILIGHFIRTLSPSLSRSAIIFVRQIS